MRYSEIMEVCNANKIKYDKGIKKLDDCNYPNDSCYALSKQIAASLEQALHVGFQRGFVHVKDIIGELTEIAAVLNSRRAADNLPIHNKRVQTIKKQVENMHTETIKEESVLKDTVQQYIDSSLDAISYLKKKYEKNGMSTAVLNESEKTFKEISSLMSKIYDDKSEEAVAKVTQICDNIKEWRASAAANMLQESSVASLKAALEGARDWTKLYNTKAKAAKTPAPVYEEDDIGYYANFEGHLRDFQSFKDNLSLVEKEIAGKYERAEAEKAQIAELKGKISAIHEKKEALRLEKKKIRRDLENGDIDEDEAYDRALDIKEKAEELDEEIESLEDRIESKESLIESMKDAKENYVNYFKDIVTKAENHIDNEPVFVSISKQVNFLTMVRVLQGMGSEQDIQDVIDVSGDIDTIIQIIIEKRNEAQTRLKKAAQEQRDILRRKREEKRREKEGERQDRKSKLRDLLGIEDDEEEEKETPVKEKTRNRMDILDDDL